MTSAMSLGVVEGTLVGRDEETGQGSTVHLSGHWHTDNRQGQTVPRLGTFLIPQSQASRSHFKGGGPEPFGAGSWPHNLTLIGFLSRQPHPAQSGPALAQSLHLLSLPLPTSPPPLAIPLTLPTDTTPSSVQSSSTFCVDASRFTSPCCKPE